MKHNLFALSDGQPFDYNRKITNNILEELKTIDELKSKNNDYEVGKKRQKKINAMRRKLDHSMDSVIVETCKYLNNNGFNHAIFEDLDNSFGKSYVKIDDINFNRIVKELKLSSLKDKFELISRKYGICFSTIHAEYTSKMCSCCGCIDDDNRPTQEEFKCVNCSFECNADVNAANNIKNRVVLTVLRNLLKQDADLKTFSPKTLSRDKLKKLLIEAFPNSYNYLEKTNYNMDIEPFYTNV